MDPLQLVLTGTFMEIAYFAFEVPTGVVADSYSRRASVIVAQVIMGISFVVTGLVTSVPLILAAAALMGFGWTFKSGAIDAWLADEVGPERLGREYQRGAQVARIFTLVGIGAAVGLALVDLRLPIVAGGLVLVALGGLLVLVMPESEFVPAAPEELSSAPLDDTHRQARRRPHSSAADPAARSSGSRSSAECGARVSTGSGRLSSSRTSACPRSRASAPIIWFGILNAVAVVLAIVVAQPLSRRFANASWRGMTWSLFWLDGAMVAATLAFAFAGSFGAAVLAYWGICVARSLAGPVYSTWLNANIEDSSVRATVISMTNLGDSAGEWGGGPVLGVVGNAFGIRAALAAGAAALTPALLLYGLALRRDDESASFDVVPQVEG